MKSVITLLRKELRSNSDRKIRISGERFFKEKVKMYGYRTADVTRLGKEYFEKLGGMTKEEIFQLCEDLWRSGYLEESFIASKWAHNLRKYFRPEDFSVFERWTDSYVTNWASCDTFCNHTVGDFLMLYPEYVESLKKWAKSENMWVRRASAVSLIIPARKGKFQDYVFEIADILFYDIEDLVLKGYGWMLKAASEADMKRVFEYVLKNRSDMPRTSLRYAIEKMPKEMRAEAMKK